MALPWETLSAMFLSVLYRIRVSCTRNFLFALAKSFSLPSALCPVCVESHVGAANVSGHFLTTVALITALGHRTGVSMLAKPYGSLPLHAMFF
jgi:hypothetical protein